jgi:hypothetical protein
MSKSLSERKGKDGFYHLGSYKGKIEPQIEVPFPDNLSLLERAEIWRDNSRNSARRLTKERDSGGVRTK